LRLRQQSGSARGQWSPADAETGRPDRAPPHPTRSRHRQRMLTNWEFAMHRNISWVRLVSIGENKQQRHRRENRHACIRHSQHSGRAGAELVRRETGGRALLAASNSARNISWAPLVIGYRGRDVEAAATSSSVLLHGSESRCIRK
jgi:hypothetical protein